ncbi:MAG: ABC transporter ATP-binding protein [Candidatus Melainabacteria bacterium]
MSTTPEHSQALLSVQDLTVSFPTEQGPAFAVNQLSLTLQAGQVMGLVGESGCGKSMSSLAILRLIPPPGRIAHGEILFEGTPLLTLPEEAMRKIRGARIALIPQDPLTSLNPVYTIGEQILEVIRLHQDLSEADARKRAAELLDMVRIPNARERMNDYPHQFSGGMRQRVMIAMALSCSPKLLIADEPTTALDVTVQAQILKLLLDIQKDHGTAILLITHDLGVVAEMCDTVSVMYAGRMVESGPVDTIFANPLHPYTQGLLRSLPTPGHARLQPIDGQPPAITALPPGCSFEPRCSQRFFPCATAFPGRTFPAENSHSVCCFLHNEAGA